MFLDLSKDYDTLDCGLLLYNLERYGAGLKLRGIPEKFLEIQQVVTSQSRYHDPQLWATHGTTQGGFGIVHYLYHSYRQCGKKMALTDDGVRSSSPQWSGKGGGPEFFMSYVEDRLL